MSSKQNPRRKRGRPAREYHIRVRTVRRENIDFAKLAQAALEQAAIDQKRSKTTDSTESFQPDGHTIGKESPDDDLE